MKKMKVTSMLLQGGLLVAFAGGFYFFTQTQVAPTEVYVFSRDISANTVISQSDLVKKYVPKDAITSDMVTNTEEVVGKAIATKAYPGEYVIKQMLVEADDIDPFEQMDLSNYRKVSISVDMKDAVGGNLKKGDTVDLVFVGQAESDNGAGEKTEFTYSKTFLQDALVYAVVDDGGRKYVDQTEGISNIVDENGEVVESGSLSVVTLAVTGAQAEEIQARLKEGTVKILGRFDESVDTSTPGYILGESGTVNVEQGNPETN
ncbi:Flp pilus assembly protein CpaB [Clostridium disporicum]|uniref:Flp pilus assembly protein CpaB n=1 Tax=Clostridium disporicum TaxID=84024 RepID=UPI0034A2924E